MIRRTQLYVVLAFAAAALALLPAVASASTPATLFQADLSGTMTMQNVATGPGTDWSTTATFPLNGTTQAGSGYQSTNPADADVWIPTGSISAPETVYGFTDPDYNLTAPDPNSSVTTEGGGAVGTCGPYELINQFSPELGVTTGSGAPALLVDWGGTAFPAGENGNPNAFPGSCDTDAGFQMSSPLTGGGNNGFDIPWSAGTDTIRFTFPAPNTSAASQTLPGTSISQTATATGQPDGAMNCPSGAGETCTDTYTQITETLTLTKICTGTVTAGKYGVTGTCGAAHATKPSGTRLTKWKFSSSKHTASFSFSATGATGYQCALATVPKHGSPKLKFASCKSPKSYSHLKKGKYEFAVRGTDSAGSDPHPASKTFKIS
jgi:hypothetical protein